MPTHIGLLRAVNLAGLNRVSMGELRDLLVKLGMTDPRTLLQSGNVVFRSDASSTTELEDLLQEATAKKLGVKTDYFVRTAKDWKAAVAANPFPKEAKADPGHLLVMFLKASPNRDAVAGLQKAIKGREVVKAEGRQAYLVYPDGVGRSRLTTALIEQKLGTRGTARNWNTVMKLAALAETST